MIVIIASFLTATKNAVLEGDLEREKLFKQLGCSQAPTTIAVATHAQGKKRRFCKAPS